MAFVLGVDIGTSSIKTSLFTHAMEEVGSASQEYPLLCPRSGWVEQDANDWWNAVKSTIRAVINDNRVDAKEISGIGVSSQSWGVLPLDKKGSILRPALLWMDRRSVEQSKKMQEWFRDAEAAIVDPSYIYPKILWIKENEKEIYEKTDKFVQVNSYINYRLCGNIAIDFSQEDPLQIFLNNTSYTSTANFLDAFGIAGHRIPGTSNPSEIIGVVSRQAATETGLAVNTPVVAGAMDTSATALSMGITEAGESFHVAGQAGAVGICLDRPVFDGRLCIHNHVFKQKWLVVGVMVATGAALRWFRDVLGNEESRMSKELGTDAYALLSSQVSASCPGSGGLVFLPYMMGERTPIWDYEARGVFYGLSLKTKKPDLIRAIMEGCSFALRHNIETLESLGLKIGSLKSGGGAIKSEAWNQIKADITKRKIECVNCDVSASFGAAILAGLGAGVFNQSLSNLKFAKKEILPNSDNAAIYDRLFDVYKKIYRNTKQEFRELADIVRTTETYSALTS